MLPTSIHINDFKSHEATQIDFEPGVVSISGTNGAGKSTVLDAIVWALFGPEALGLGRKSESVIREGASKACVILEFIVDGSTYQVIRSRTVSGKAVTELRSAFVPSGRPGEYMDNRWVSITKATAKETQRAIEELVGSYETFLQGPFIGQGDASRFANATPAERKATLSQALDLDRYPALVERARELGRGVEAQVRRFEQQLANDRAELAGAVTEQQVRTHEEELAKSRARLVEVQQEAERAVEAVADARVAAAAQESARATAQQLRAIATQAQVDLTAANTQLATAQAAAKASHAAADRVAELEAKLPIRYDIPPMEAEVATAASTLADLRQESAALSQKRQAHAAATGAAARASTDLQAAADAEADAQRKLDELEGAPSMDCPTCHQGVIGEARERTLATLRSGLEAMQVAKAQKRAVVDQLLAELEQIEEPSANREAELAADIDAAGRALTHAQGQLANARATEARFQELSVQIASARAAVERREELDAAAAAAGERVNELTVRYTDAAAAAAEAEANVDTDHAKRLAELEERVRIKRAAVAQVSAIVDRRAADLEQARVHLEQAQRRAKAVELGQAQLGRLKRQGEIWATLVRAFGRDGIPAQVMRHAKPQIEADANGILADFQAPYRVRLDLERDTKAGTVSDTLDITILADGHERSFDLLSGGERTRANTAIRVALARVLANRSGKPIRTLVMDEPDGLDTDGFAALSAMLKALGREFPLVLCVSHTDGLAPACDRHIQVDKVNGISRVTAA